MIPISPKMIRIKEKMIRINPKMIRIKEEMIGIARSGRQRVMPLLSWKLQLVDKTGAGIAG